MKNKFAIVFISLCVAFFSCCCCGGFCCGEEITYRVDGMSSTSAVSVEFNNDFGDTERFSSVKLPWVYRFNVKERASDYYGGKYHNNKYPAYLKAITNDKRAGSVSVAIFVNGKKVRTATNTESSPTTATASYDVDL